ncbi:Uncharacterised protein [Vibrio cholerae]|nr:Uncharacterised protein [Vibrio cholerae]CSB10444.1 Uncharacterised protein [Vibrio cholerae]CSB12480.1 Uncharacterised protein [Vibrio cholerae]CSD07479.1 Uncharacterised protein [Vibrio cholerae]
MNTMPQVEHVACATLAKSSQNTRHLFTNSWGRSIQNRRIHIALQCHFISHTRFSVGDIDRPI